MTSFIQKQAITTARELLAIDPVFLDTETTGTGSKAEIIEISVIDISGETLIDTLVKPVGRIPFDATRIHGIDNQMVHEARSWILVWPEVRSILEGRTVGIYNADFDLRMIKQTNQKYGFPWRYPMMKSFCIMKLYSQFYGTSRWQTLANAGRQSRITIPNSHRALDDTRLTRELFFYMANWGRGVVI